MATLHHFRSLRGAIPLRHQQRSSVAVRRHRHLPRLVQPSHVSSEVSLVTSQYRFFSCFYVRHYARFDFFGIYVVMFMEILKTLLQVLLVFSILIVAFALTFYILFFQVVSACFL